ncbi:MAG: type II secretion system F family protein [Dehalococcoidia bacterium]
MGLLVLATGTAGAFVFTVTLWLTRFGVQPELATARLARLKGEGTSPTSSIASLFSLRKRTNIQFGGISLVNTNIVEKWRIQLERAGLALNVREYFILRVGIGLALTAVGAVLLPMPALALLLWPFGFFAVGFWVKRRIGSRTRKLESQLVELLQMLSSGLRAGFGLMQALEGAAEQLPSPLSMEVRRTLRDTAMGAAVEQALGTLNQRVGSADFDIVITAILIQRSVGGNLAEILDNVAHTMRERERIKGEIRTLTSQQRMTGYVIGGIPIGLAGIFYLISPDFMSLLFTDKLGLMMLGAAAVMWSIGFFIINKIVSIEV